MARPCVEPFLHEPSSTFSYVIWDPETRRAAVIDPVLDFDLPSGRARHQSADAILAYVRENALTVDWILETHAHADHLTAAPYIKQAVGGQIAIGEGIQVVQGRFKTLFNLSDDALIADGRDFDHLFCDQETFQVGNLRGRVIATPGHTSDSVSYLFDDTLFVGDTLFMPDYGTARCDFPGGDARLLYQSIKRLFALPDTTRMFLCHDYPPDGRDFECETTVLAQKEQNIHVGPGMSEDQFVELRTARDTSLPVPELIIPSVQVNICAGRLPESEENGVSYLKLPLDVF